MLQTIASFTDNGDSEEIGGFYGDFCIAVEGDFGGGTLQFVFLDEEDNELEHNTTDWSFTQSPEFPQAWGFPAGVKFIIRLSGATSPDLKVKVSRYLKGRA